MGFLDVEKQLGKMIKLHLVDCVSRDLQFVGVAVPTSLSV